MQNKLLIIIILFIVNVQLIKCEIDVSTRVISSSKQIKIELLFKNKTNDSIFIPLSTVVLGINKKINDEVLVFPDSSDFYFRLMIIPENSKCFNQYSVDFDYCPLNELTDFLLIKPNSENTLTLYLDIKRNKLNPKSKYNMILSFPYIDSQELQEYFLIDKRINYNILEDTVTNKYHYKRIYDKSDIIVYNNNNKTNYDFNKHRELISKFNKRVNLRVLINCKNNL